MTQDLLQWDMYVFLTNQEEKKKDLNSSFKNSDYFFFVSSWGILHSISFQNERFIYFPR